MRCESVSSRPGAKDKHIYAGLHVCLRLSHPAVTLDAFPTATQIIMDLKTGHKLKCLHLYLKTTTSRQSPTGNCSKAITQYHYPKGDIPQAMVNRLGKWAVVLGSYSM